jgi:isoleucyl-tRNA synthetase
MSEDGEETVCIGSVEELFQLSGVRVTDLHREFVDKVRSKVSGKSLSRSVGDPELLTLPCPLIICGGL